MLIMEQRMKPETEFIHLDTSAFMNYYAGLEKNLAARLYTKSANLFIENIHLRTDSLKKYLLENKNHDAKILSHQLRGSLLTIGGTNLAETFYKIEEELDHTPNATLLSLLENKQSAISTFIEELKEWTEIIQKK